jgi:hypothetical protein
MPVAYKHFAYIPVNSCKYLNYSEVSTHFSNCQIVNNFALYLIVIILCIIFDTRLKRFDKEDS